MAEEIKLEMHHQAITHVENPGPVAIAGKWKTTLYAVTAVGALAFIAGVFTSPERAWHNYLVGYFMFLCFGLFGLFFTAIHHAVNARWWIVARRVTEGFTAFLPAALILFIGIVIGAKAIFPWAAGEVSGQADKYRWWLSVPWFAVRHVIFLVLWILFARKLTSLSLKQDETGDPQLSRKMINWSILFLPVFAGTFSLTCFDLLMSIQPKWYSTLFGVYGFAGLFQSGLALLAIVFVILKRQGSLTVATPSHVKDIGTLLFAFTIFMTYIGFSQYMLIWYANLPEETIFFIKRQTGGWQYLFLALPVFKFAIPFFGLLSQAFKKNENWLLAVCVAVIVGQYVDVYWLVMPGLSETLVPIGWLEIGTFLLFAGIFTLTVTRFYSRHSILAAKDPRILESANWRFWE